MKAKSVFLALAFAMLVCVSAPVHASPDMDGPHGSLQCDTCHVGIPFAGQPVDEIYFVGGSQSSLCRSCHEMTHATAFRSLASQFVISAEWRYNVMNDENCYPCHTLATGGSYPYSSYISYGWGLADFQMCKNCHVGNPYSGNTQPFTIVDEGYDYRWPAARSHRIFLFDLEDGIAAGRITFVSTIFSTERDIPFPAGTTCPRFSCRDVSPGYSVRLSYRNLGNPAVSGTQAFEDLWTFSRTDLVWPLAGLPGGSYQVTLTPYHQSSAGVPFVVQVDIPGSCDLAIASFQASSATLNTSAGESVTFSGDISSSQAVDWRIDIVSPYPPEGGSGENIVDSLVGTGGTVSAVWDGRDPFLNIVPPGDYLARLTATSGPACSGQALAVVSVDPFAGCSLNAAVGSSVNLASGTLAFSQELFSARGGALPAGLTLSYRSLGGYHGPLGTNWSHDLDVFLKASGDDSYALHGGDGRWRLLVRNGDVYTPRALAYPILRRNADGTAVLEQKEGLFYHFDALGRVQSLSDRNGNTRVFSYDGAGRLASATDPAGRSTSFVYDLNGRISTISAPDGSAYGLTYAGDLLVAVAGPDGSSWSYTYDASSRLSTKTDPLGHATTYGYDALGRLVNSTDPEGNTKTVAFSPENATTVLTEKDGGAWTYRYDAHLGVLQSKTDPQGNARNYVYDGSRNLLSETDPQGGVNRYSYDSAGNTLSATDAAGNVTAYTYNVFNQTASLTDAEGKITAFAYDDRGNLTATTDAAGGTTRQEYDATGNVVRRISALGAATLFTYDAFENLASITDPTGVVAGFAYDLMGNLVRRTDPNGATTLMTYDVRGRLTSVTDQTGGTTSFAYDAAGNRISQTDQNGRVTRSEYDANGRLSRMIDPAGGVTTYVYGSSGCPSCATGVDRLIAVTDPNGHTTRYEYDLEGRRIAEIDALGNTVRYAYDSLGNLVSRTDAEGRTTSYAYDVLSRRTGVTDAMGGAMQTVYAPTGLVTGVTDPNGVTTAYEYDAAGRLTRTLSPDRGNTALTYNADGTLKSKTDANGTVVNYFYDASGRLARLAFPDPAQDISYGYDAATSENGRGRLTSLTDPSGTTVYHYDARGYVIREVRMILGVGYTARYEYDAAGNLTAITYPSGRTVRSILDARNRPTAVSSTLVSTQSLAAGITYDPAGNPVALTLGNGIPPAWGYDGANRVASITIPGIAALIYAYDLSGNILSITDSVHVESSKSYAYDALDRLIDASGPWGGLMWSYDGNGNRLTQDGATGYAMYGYQGNRLTSETVGAIQSTYTYDAAGNTMSDDRRAFVYDQNQRLMQVRIDGDLAGEYVYDGKGRRVIKRTGPAAIVSSSPQNVVYHYDLAGRLIEETATDGKLLVDYVYLEGRPLAMIRKQSTGEETFYYHDDHLGSPILMTDKLGKVVWNVAMIPSAMSCPRRAATGPTSATCRTT